jgi:hypothetical protein
LRQEAKRASDASGVIEASEARWNAWDTDVGRTGVCLERTLRQAHSIKEESAENAAFADG